MPMLFQPDLDDYLITMAPGGWSIRMIARDQMAEFMQRSVGTQIEFTIKNGIAGDAIVMACALRRDGAMDVRLRGEGTLRWLILPCPN